MGNIILTEFSSKLSDNNLSVTSDNEGTNICDDNSCNQPVQTPLRSTILPSPFLILKTLNTTLKIFLSTKGEL